jgi:hypothetical protein
MLPESDSGGKAAAAAAPARGVFANRVAGKLAACLGSKKSSKSSTASVRSRAVAWWAEMQPQLNVLAATAASTWPIGQPLCMMR